MKISKRRAHLLLGCIIVLCCILIVPLVILPALTPPDVWPAIEKAISFFEEGSGDPYALLFLDVLYRRFGITEFSNALERYDQLLANDAENAAMLRLFRRIADYDNPLQAEDLKAVKSPYDYITVPALYCDQMELSEDYLLMLYSSMTEGGYSMTHVLLALIWIQENGYDLSPPEGFIEAVYNANVELIEDDQDVYDIELEAAAFLYFAGQGTRISDSFVKSVVEAQNEDGSWGTFEDNWHTTVLALTVLLHVDSPSNSYPPMLAK